MPADHSNTIPETTNVDVETVITDPVLIGILKSWNDCLINNEDIDPDMLLGLNNDQLEQLNILCDQVVFDDEVKGRIKGLIEFVNACKTGITPVQNM